ncbi:NAD(P)H-dependent glycerol-3-phosphate dehydrogenase [Corynebacterium otitidis]|nr:NAD(P)H-dependent glycerol-3-phosphate dehydrogenase [Corynebacterium otitidis]
MARVAVMGAGSWGTTIAKVFVDAGNDVTVWARRDELARAIDEGHENPDYLPGTALPESLRATSDEKEALAGAEIVVLAVPAQTLRGNLRRFGGLIPGDALVVQVAKGVELDTGRLMTQVLEEETGIENSRSLVLTGPNLAREVAAGQPAASVIACAEPESAKRVQSALATDYFRPYTNTDVVGCEIAGACKNVIALACGIAAGTGLGINSAAATMTRGNAEITRLGEALGANPRTFLGLAGMGDLVATCTSPLSRNRSFGEALGRGEGLEAARAATNGQVAEGVVSSSAVRSLAESLGVDMPITQAVYRVCHAGDGVEGMIAQLMGRRYKPEYPGAGAAR